MSFSTSNTSRPNPVAKNWNEAYASIPMSFEPDAEEAGAPPQFKAFGQGYTLMLTPTEAVLNLSRRAPDGGSTKSAALHMRLDGANANPRVRGESELQGKANYFMGSDPSKWRTNVPTYGKVRYSEVYPGTDLVYYGNGRKLEYDFVLAAGADPGRIHLAFEGMTDALVGGNGDLVLEMGASGEEVRFQRPVAYQNIDGEKQEVAAEYYLEGGKAGFKIGEYDAQQPLVIDPVLSYSTYYGTSNDDYGSGIAVDAAGNAYIIGNQPGLKVFKLNSSGTAVLYSTNISGNEPGGIAVDASGNAYLTGRTAGGLPATNAAQPAYGDGHDAFVVKLSSNGSSILYATYLGGSSEEKGTSIAIDGAGNAYVTGFTKSTNFPTVNPVQSAMGGGVTDAFVTKVNSTGTAFVYSTYFGGNGDDTANGIALDGSGNAYVTGSTNSTNLTTLNPFQSTFSGGSGGATDGFLTKFNATGSSLLFSTYFGGGGYDSAYSVAVDATGSAYVTGSTESSNFPVVNAYQPALAAHTDAFFTKFTPSGSSLVYSTYFGGPTHADAGLDIAVDSSGSAYIAGAGRVPVTFNTDREQGAFVAQLNPSGSVLAFSAILGGDAAYGIAVDSSGNIYVTGQVGAYPIVTATPLQPVPAGAHDAFITKISPGSAGPLPTLTTVSPDSGQPGQSVNVTLTGTGFVTGSTQVAITGSGVTGGTVNVTSATSLSVTLTISAGAAVGTRNITVITPNGPSNAVTFTVAGPPTLSLINIPSGAQGTTTSVTVTGTNFLNGSTVYVSGTGVTASSVTVASMTQITMNLTVSASAAAGPRDITVTTAQGTSNAVTFTVVAATSNLTIATPSPLLAGSVGTAYSQTLTAIGGTPPYTSWILTAGSVPAGLSLNATTGIISGTPTVGGVFNFTAQVSDSAAATASKAFQITIGSTGLTISTASPLPAGTAGVAYAQTLAAIGGAPPYSNWSVTGGSLPAGLFLNDATGILSGTPTATGTFIFVVQVTDSLSSIGTKSFQLTIAARSLTITTSSPLPAGAIDTPYSQALIVNGGTAPYSWVVNAGSLPPGLALNATTGVIAGTPTANGTFTFTVLVTDSLTTTATKEFSISIASAGAALAQIASGGGWKTTITLVNPSTTPVTVRFRFYADNGAPLPLPVTVSTTGANSTNSVLDATIDPRGSFIAESEATSESILAGWADVQASGPINGFSIFRYRSSGNADSEGTVALDTRPLSSLTLPYDNTAGFQTGVALVNQSVTAATIGVVLRDDRGVQLATTQISLPALGHTAFFLSTAVPLSASRRGTAEFQNPAGNVLGVGLRFSPTGSFTSIPIIR